MGDYKVTIKIAGQLEKSFQGALKGAQAGLKGLSTIGKIGTAALGASAVAIGGVAAASIKVGSSFDTAMSSTAATAGATAEQYDKLRAAAMEMGRTTSKTATESANALEYMSLAGWSVDQSIAGLPSVLKLSEASGMDLARCSDLVTDSMAATGQTVNDLAGYLDICAKAQNKSNQSAGELMEAYIGVGGTMNNLGVPITESATALGVLANRGLKGSEAGNALNAIMVNMTTGAGQAGEMMQKLGVSAFDSQGNFIGLEATLQQLNGKLKGLTAEQRNAALAAIGGKTHLDAMNDLMAGLNTTTADGTTEWAALTAELENSAGALEAMRDIKLDNLNGDIATFQSALQDCGIRIYDNLNKPLREATQYGTQAIYQLSDALESGGFEGLVGEIGNVLAQSVTVIASYGPQFVSMAVNLAMNFLSGITQNAGQIASGAAQIGSSLLIGLLQFIPAMVSTGSLLLGQFLAGIAQQMPSIMQEGIAGTQQLVSGLLQNLPLIISSGTSIINSLLQGLVQMLPMLLVGGLQAVVMIAQGLAQALPMMIQSGVALIGQLLLGLIQMLPSLLSAGLQLVMSLAQGLIQSLPMILSIGAQAVVSLVQGLLQALPMIIQTGIQLIITFIQGIISNLGNIAQAAVQIVTALAVGLIGAVPTLIAAIPQLIEGIVDTIFSTDWLQVGADMIAGIADGFMSGFTSLVDSVKGLWSDFTGWLFGDGEEAGESTGEGVAAGIEAGTPAATQAASAAAQATASSYTLDYSMIQGYGTEGTAALANGVTAATGTTTAAATSTGNATMDALNASIASYQESLNATAQQSGISITDGFGIGIQSNQQSVIDIMGQTGTTSMESLNQMLASYQPTLQTTAMDIGTATTDGMTAGITAGSGNFTEQINQLGTDSMNSLNETLASCQSMIDQTASQNGTAMTEGIGTGITSGMAAATAAAQNSGTETINAMANSISEGTTQIQTTIQELTTTVTESLNQCWENVNTEATTAWSNIGTGMQTSLTQIVTEMSTALANVGAEIQTAVTEWQASVTSGMAQMVAAIRSGCSQAIAIARSMASSINSIFSSMNLQGAGINAMSGLISGMNAMRGAVMATAASIANAAADAVNNALKIHSPSRVLADSGKYSGEGLIVGMENMRGAVKAAAQESFAIPVQEVSGDQKRRNMEIPTFTSRTSVIGETLQGLSGSQNDSGNRNAGQSDGGTFVFSPTYRFEGGTPNKDEVIEANRMSQREFEKMMKEYLRNNRRTAFA